MRLPLATERVSHHGRKGYKRKRLRTHNHNVYSDEDKAHGLVIAALVGSRKAAQLLPIPQQTLQDWRQGRGITNEIRVMAKHFAQELSEKLANVANLIADDMPNKIGAAGLKDQAITLGIVVDKRQLLEGLPTAINEGIVGMSADDRAKRVAELMSRAQRRTEDSEDGS